MDKLKAMSVFVSIVDKGGLSKAADHLGRSPAAIVRTLSELEDYLGIRLLNRSTRRIALTDDGRDYLLHCRKILADVEAAEFSIDVRRKTVTGRLTLTAPVTFGRLHLAPLIQCYMKTHPNLQIELILLDRVVDIIEEGYDLALRIGLQSDSSMIAKRVGQVRSIDKASTLKNSARILGLLEQHLSQHDWLALNRPTLGECAVFPYVALAHEGGINLGEYPSVQAWITRIKELPGFIGMPAI
jgi:DNA-binding transcriptional LysR family regulator